MKRSSSLHLSICTRTNMHASISCFHFAVWPETQQITGLFFFVNLDRLCYFTNCLKLFKLSFDL